MKIGSTVVLKPNVVALSSASTSEAFEPGTQLDRYLILDCLGSGGSGQVYRARDTELDREVALKILSRPRRQQSDALNRVRAEAQAQARLRSPHVVTLYSLLELPSAAVLVLEYVEGETLEQRLKTGGPLSAEEAIAIFEQALLGLSHVHEMGVIHRDLKPGNLFLTASGVVKIMDFSVARMTTHDAFPPRTMVGTLLYSAPEQISGRGTDERSDIYAMGMTLYEAVTGRLPFEHRSEYALIHAQVQEQPPRPRDLAPALPAGLERVILKSIEKEPERRYHDAMEFRTALLKYGARSSRRITVSLPANAYGPVPPPKTRRRSGRRVFAGFALDLLLVAAVYVMLYALVLNPVKKPTASPPVAKVTSVKPQHAAAPKPVRAHKKPAPKAARVRAPAAAPRAPAATPRSAQTRPSPPTAKKRAQGGLKALRKAWGN